MKSFLIKISIFAIFPILITITTYTFRIKKVHYQFKDISEHYSILIMGDSHMARINPSIFKEEAINIACPGEHYFFTYSKLRSIINNKNNKIETLLIGLSPHNFSPIYQKLYDFNKAEGKASLKDYLYFIDILDCKDYQPWNFIKNSFFYKGVFTSPQWGGWFSSKYSNPTLPIILKSVSAHYSDNHIDSFDSQFYYLTKIVELCENNNIKLITISMPVHEEYKSRIPQKYFYLSNIALVNYGNRIRHIDYLNKKMSGEYFSDGDHLNDIGSDIITTKVDSLIKSLKQVNVTFDNSMNNN